MESLPADLSFFQKKLVIYLFICYYIARLLNTPACRNGRRGRLKICCGQPRMGSSPIAGSFYRESKCCIAAFRFFCHIGNS